MTNIDYFHEIHDKTYRCTVFPERYSSKTAESYLKQKKSYYFSENLTRTRIMIEKNHCSGVRDSVVRDNFHVGFTDNKLFDDGWRVKSGQ